MSEPHPHDKANLPHYLDVMTRAEVEHEWYDIGDARWESETYPGSERFLLAPHDGSQGSPATRRDLDALLGSCVRWLNPPDFQFGISQIEEGNYMAGVRNPSLPEMIQGTGPTPLAACIAAMESILKEKEC